MEHRRFETWIGSMARAWMAVWHGWVAWLANLSAREVVRRKIGGWRFEAEEDQQVMARSKGGVAED
jgi:hypothetical protein